MKEKKDNSWINEKLKTQVYAQFRIDNIYRFLNRFREFFLEDTFFYRGQANAEWGLESSYDRAKSKNGTVLYDPAYCDNGCDKFLFRGELAAIKYYMATNDSFRNTRHPKIEVLSEMQHYGASTRLLDVTESFGVALFFALVGNDEKKDVAIWAINKRVLLDNYFLAKFKKIPVKRRKGYHLFNPHVKEKDIHLEEWVTARFSKNETFLNEQICVFAEELIGNKEVITPPKPFPYSTVCPGVFPVRPMILNNRLLAQNGLFLLQQSLEFPFLNNLLNTLNISLSKFKKVVSSAVTPNISSKEYDSELLNTALVKFIIPQSEFDSCKSILKSMNINYKSLFPDKYGLIKTAEMKYFPDERGK